MGQLPPGCPYKHVTKRGTGEGCVNEELLSLCKWGSANFHSLCTPNPWFIKVKKKRAWTSVVTGRCGEFWGRKIENTQEEKDRAPQLESPEKGGRKVQRKEKETQTRIDKQSSASWGGQRPRNASYLAQTVDQTASGGKGNKHPSCDLPNYGQEKELFKVKF